LLDLPPRALRQVKKAAFTLDIVANTGRHSPQNSILKLCHHSLHGQVYVWLRALLHDGIEDLCVHRTGFVLQQSIDAGHGIALEGNPNDVDLGELPQGHGEVPVHADGRGSSQSAESVFSGKGDDATSGLWTVIVEKKWP